MRNEKGQFVKGSHWRPPQKFRERLWLEDNYTTQQRSTGDIAREFGVSDAAILYWLKKHAIRRRSISESRACKHWGSEGPDNPMWNKRGELNPRWQGGITPERQAFYQSTEWKKACSEVWRRDRATCVRCGLRKTDSPDTPFHIHHIEGFVNEGLRAETTNLALVCEICHHFIHSKKNTSREYLPKI